MRSADMPYTVKTCDASETSESVRIVLFRSGCDRPKRPTTLQESDIRTPCGHGSALLLDDCRYVFRGSLLGTAGRVLTTVFLEIHDQKTSFTLHFRGDKR